MYIALILYLICDALYIADLGSNKVSSSSSSSSSKKKIHNEYIRQTHSIFLNLFFDNCFAIMQGRIEKVNNFKYLWAVEEENGDMDMHVGHSVGAAWGIGVR